MNSKYIFNVDMKCTTLYGIIFCICFLNWNARISFVYHSWLINFLYCSTEDCRKDLKVKSKAPLTEFLEIVKLTLSQAPKEPLTADSVRYQLLHVRDVLERWKIVGLNRKLQLKPRKFTEIIDATTNEVTVRCTEVAVILKWGGKFTS